jgi:hypothetical protein
MLVDVTAIENLFEMDRQRERTEVELFLALPDIMRKLRGNDTQAVFAEKLGVQKLAISQIENGKGKAIGRPVLRKLLEMSKEEK